MELQSRSSVRDRLPSVAHSFSDCEKTSRKLFTDKGTVCDYCSTFFFRLRKDGSQAEVAGYTQSTYLYGYVTG